MGEKPKKVECKECGGEGYFDVIDYSRVNSRTISPPYKQEQCEDCNGTGVLAELEEPIIFKSQSTIREYLLQTTEANYVVEEISGDLEEYNVRYADEDRDHFLYGSEKETILELFRLNRGN